MNIYVALYQRSSTVLDTTITVPLVSDYKSKRQFSDTAAATVRTVQDDRLPPGYPVLLLLVGRERQLGLSILHKDIR